MSLFVSSFILAIAFCAPPGVITAETVRRGAARGFIPALFVQLGSLVGDTTWAIIALTGLAFIVQNHIAKIVLSLIGILLMLKLAWGRKFVRPTFFRWVNFACGMALGFFAVQLGLNLLQNLQ